tara:strand:+ start:288 stop:554 length:267 start_codon:yes stop_codon:yes gene_type:complete
MNHSIRQIVKTIPTRNIDRKSRYYAITKIDRENGVYEIEDGENTFFAWDDCLLSVTDEEFLNAYRNNLIDKFLVENWLFNSSKSYISL